MSEKIVVPVLGESITEATVSKWLKNEGDNVEADEPIVELETDKVNLEVPSPISGILSKIESKDGSVVEVGALLGLISEINDSSKKVDTIKKIEPSNLKNTQPTDLEDNVINLDKQKPKDDFKIFEQKDEKVEPEPLVLTNEVKEDKTSKIDQVLSPAVRKIVNDNNINIDSVKGSGKDGRVLKGDLITSKIKPTMLVFDFEK